MSPRWRGFVQGVLAALAVVILALLFLAYQQPAMLLDWANLRYCG